MTNGNVPATPALRYPPVDPASATEQQRRVAGEIASGPRGSVSGPFLALLHAPELAGTIQKVGEYLRFDSSLPQNILECAIMTVGRHWSCAYECRFHEPLALAAGVPQVVLDGLADARERESFPPDYRAVIGFCRQALTSGTVEDAEFQAIEAQYGRQGTLELLAVCGYYSTLAMVLNTGGIR
jgi:4-carboxymuconolactone decarboxylase